MRNSFVGNLEKYAELDDRIVLLVGDIGFGVFEKFNTNFPNRFINMGIAEQNMISVASGLAKEGYLPVVYTIIPFLTMRAFEQIRVDICMHDRDVLLVGVGSGYSYDILGPTHHALEDISIMRSLPNMTIYTPSAPSQLDDICEELFNVKGPRYLRLGKNGEPNLLNQPKYDREKGSYKFGQKSNIVLLSHGAISSEVETARLNLIEKLGIDIIHLTISRIEPLSENLVIDEFQSTEIIFVIEENYLSGSLYSNLCEILINKKDNSPLIFPIHPRKSFETYVGKRNEILQKHCLDEKNISKFVQERLIEYKIIK